MRDSELAGIDAFLVLAQELNFRRAAKRLDLSPSMLSKLIRGLEQRVGARLFNRTTRSVALSEAGRLLAAGAAPALATLRQALDDAGTAGGEPTGSVRVNLPQLAGQLVFAPALGRFVEAYPRICLELVVEDALTDVIARGCDAGVRLGPAVQGDMVAVPVSGPLRTVIVASPDYLASHPAPVDPVDLARHTCLNYRWSATGALFPWALSRNGETRQLVVDARIIVNDADLLVRAALSGAGLAMILEERVSELLNAGHLVGVLDEWCPVLPGFFLYYPAGRHTSPALRVVAAFFRATIP